MFTGIVRERGRVAAVDGGDGLRLRSPRRRRRGVAVGDSVAIGGVCLTVVARRRRASSRSTPSPETLAPHDARRASPRAPRSTSSRRSARASRSAATSSRATSTASAAFARSSRRATARGSGSTRRRRCSATASRRARSPSTASSLTVAALDDAGFAVALDPAHARRDDARQRSRRATPSTSRSTSSRSTSSGCCPLR